MTDETLLKNRKNQRHPGASYLEVLNNLCSSLRDEKETEEEEENLIEICHQVWLKFSSVHQKSPTHKNNNVRRCVCSNSTTADEQTMHSSKTKVHLKAHDNDNSKTGSESRKLLRLLKATQQAFGQFVTALCIFFKILFFSLLLFTFCYCVVVLHKPTQAFVSRNTQDLIYPFMRFFRLLALPFVRNHPTVTKLYEDSCLVNNPYFTIQDIDCWPCETSRTIVDLTGFSNFSAVYHGSGIPFIVKDAFHVEVGPDELARIALENQELLLKIHQESGYKNSLASFQSSFKDDPRGAFGRGDSKAHIRWKINRVSTVRALRKYFPKPYFIPSTTEVSIQHFLFLDQNESPSYPLPRTEFANVFVTQASGTRLIALIPTEWCKSRCKLLSVLLKPRDVLFYNWLFWRPISGPVSPQPANNHGNLSITYVGSFY